MSRSERQNYLEPLPRMIAEGLLSRVAGAALVEGNAVRLLRDAAENYPAWLDAIAAAERTINFENYIIDADEVGRMFADALIAKARQGVTVRVLYDWMGSFRKTPARFWAQLRDAYATLSAGKLRGLRARWMDAMRISPEKVAANAKSETAVRAQSMAHVPAGAAHPARPSSQAARRARAE